MRTEETTDRGTKVALAISVVPLSLRLGTAHNNGR